MEMLQSLLSISLGAILINNFIFSQFLGCCPFLGVSQKVDSAIGMGLAVTFVMGLASALSYVVNLVLIHFGLDQYLQTLAFILIIASLVQLVEMFLKKSIPSLYSALGIYLPLITTNCAVLGVAITNVQKEYGILTGIVNGFATAVGFTIAIVILAGIREKLEHNDVPASFKGMPMVLLTAGLMAIAFCGFSGLL